MDGSSLLLMSLCEDRAVEHLIPLKSLEAGDAGRLAQWLGDGGSGVGGGPGMWIPTLRLFGEVEPARDDVVSE